MKKAAFNGHGCLYVFAKHLPYLQRLSDVSFAPAVERLLVTLHNSMACHDSFVTREAKMSQEKGLNSCVCTYASECHFCIVALKPADQISKDFYDHCLQRE